MLSTTRNDPASILQLLLSGAGLLFALLIAGVTGLVGVIQLVQGRGAISAEDASVFTMAWVALLVAALAIPSLLFSLFRLTGRSFSLPEWVDGYRIAWVLLVFLPVILTVGYYFSQNEQLAWLFLPPLSVLAISIPIFWIISMAQHKLPSGSAQRGWGLANFSLFVSVPTIIVVELMAFFVGIVAVALVVALRPEWQSQLQQLTARLQSLQSDPENLLEALRPMLQSPLALFALFAALSVFTPLIEELLKPLAMWALVGKRLSPAEGFGAGALCGGMFALLESLLNLTGPFSDAWITQVVGRAGTGVLHIGATALLGWALASAWQNGSYVRLGLAYLTSVILHGLWNGLNILTWVGVLQAGIAPGALSSNRLVMIGPAALAGMAVFLLLWLWGANRFLRNRTEQ